MMQRMKREIVAHRGWSSRAPENTMAAFDLAVSNPGISRIELDVQMSRDQVPVVIHDFTLNRTTGASGRVGDYTFRELEKLDAGSWFSPKYAGERIPSLENVLVKYKGRIKLDVELKTAIGLYPNLEQAVADLLRHHGWVRDVVVTSFDHYAIQRIRSIDPDIRTGLIIGGLPMLVKEQLTFTGATMLSMNYLFISRDMVRDWIGEGIEVMAWTVNEPDAIRHMLAMHPKLMICTNYPDRALRLAGQ